MRVLWVCGSIVSLLMTLQTSSGRHSLSSCDAQCVSIHCVGYHATLTSFMKQTWKLDSSVPPHTNAPDPSRLCVRRAIINFAVVCIFRNSAMVLMSKVVPESSSFSLAFALPFTFALVVEPSTCSSRPASAARFSESVFPSSETST